MRLSRSVSAEQEIRPAADERRDQGFRGVRRETLTLQLAEVSTGVYPCADTAGHQLEKHPESLYEIGFLPLGFKLRRLVRVVAPAKEVLQRAF